MSGTVLCIAGGVGKNRDSRLISGFRVDHWWSAINNFGGRPCISILVSDDVHYGVYRADRHASVNLVYRSQH